MCLEENLRILTCIVLLLDKLCLRRPAPPFKKAMPHWRRQQEQHTMGWPAQANQPSPVTSRKPLRATLSTWRHSRKFVACRDCQDFQKRTNGAAVAMALTIEPSLATPCPALKPAQPEPSKPKPKHPKANQTRQPAYHQPSPQFPPNPAGWPSPQALFCPAQDAKSEAKQKNCRSSSAQLHRQ